MRIPLQIDKPSKSSQSEMGQSGSDLRAASRRGQQPGGGGGNDDVKRQVDSDVNHQKPIYQLVNVKTGGGKLIEIIKLQAKQQSSLATTTTTTTSGSTSSNIQRADSVGGHQNVASSSSIHHHRQHPSVANKRPIDEQIRALVAPLLYNEGRGKLVSLEELWCHRMGLGSPRQAQVGAKSSSSQGDASSGPNLDPSSASSMGHRLVCWKLEERGFVGETGLHICFLLSTQSHMILAQKLLALFPALINDIYTCDEYFGESSLHMAIVNENFKIVKLLLDHGANVHERCLGSFFLPADLKDGANSRARRDLVAQAAQATPSRSARPDKQRAAVKAGGCSDDHQAFHEGTAKLSRSSLESNHFTRWTTNFEGYAYWGEYPLSFAVSLGLADCYRLLLAKGADPNRQDSLGNSSLHLAVIANRLDMFDLCYSSGAKLEVSNRLNLSPLTLAAKLRRTQMFFHILTIQRQVNWIFCNVGFLETPLQGLDSIDTLDGSCNDDSVLALVVSGNSNEHLQMLDGLVSELLHVKWVSSTRQKFNSWLRLFLVFLLLSSVAYITRFQMSPSSSSSTIDSSAKKSPDRSVVVHLELVNLASESLLLCFVLYYLYIILARIAPQTRRSPSTGLAIGSSRVNLRALEQAPEVAVFLFTCLLILICLPLRLLGLRATEDFLAAIVMFLLPLKLLFFCRASKSLGPFIVMIYKILMNDVLCFVVFLVIFVAGFSQSFLIIFKSHQQHQHQQQHLPVPVATNSTSWVAPTAAPSDKNHFDNLFDGVISMHMMAWNEFGLVVDEFAATDYPQLARLLFCVYMILVSILLVNMLIAMLGKTYQEISSQPNENLRQWARASLTIERLWSNGDRLRALDRYSHLVAPTATGCPTDRETSAGRRFPPAGGAQQVADRYYSSTWALTSESLAEIEAIRRLVGENRLNARRFSIAN